MDSIYKCYDGTYIDLERVVSMSYPIYDRIYIYFQLTQNPIILLRWREDKTSLLNEVGKEFTTELMKIEFDNLVNVWREYKKSKL